MLLKSLFDFSVALLGIVILSPVMMIISILIMLYDHGPVFFKQKRVGKFGKPFIIYKFRSMTPLKYAGEGLFRPGDSSRITPVGKFLRRTKFDELPQLFNVLKGDMSLVGPRPEVEEWVKANPDKWRDILTIKPGITDNASVLFRNEEELLCKSENPDETYRNIILPRKLDLYLEYMNSHTFKGDIMILLSTVKTVIFK